MTGPLELAALCCFAMAFQAALLGITGVLHLARPEALRTAAGAHRATGAVPGWLTRVERPALIGAIELLLALGVGAALLSSAPVVALVAEIFVAAYAALLVVFLTRLRRAGMHIPCGCHPLAGSVTRASSAPAMALLIGASFAVVAIAGGSDLAPPAAPRVIIVSMLAAVAAATLLVAAGAADDALAAGTA